MAIPTNPLQDAILNMLFQGTDPSWRPNATLYLSLHTADPGDAGTQLTSEATYTGYVRKTTNHSSVDWTLTSHAMKNGVLLAFAACTGGSNTITYVGLGLTAISGGDTLLLRAPLAAALAVSNGITPQFAINALSFTVA